MNLDPRVEKWFMMTSPVPSFLVCMLYFVVVKAAPAFMANRKPFEIRKILMFYNLGMVLLSGYIFLEVSIDL